MSCLNCIIVSNFSLLEKTVIKSIKSMQGKNLNINGFISQNEKRSLLENQDILKNFKVLPNDKNVIEECINKSNGCLIIRLGKNNSKIDKIIEYCKTERWLEYQKIKSMNIDTPFRPTFILHSLKDYSKLINSIVNFINKNEIHSLYITGLIQSENEKDLDFILQHSLKGEGNQFISEKDEILRNEFNVKNKEETENIVFDQGKSSNIKLYNLFLNAVKFEMKIKGCRCNSEI